MLLNLTAASHVPLEVEEGLVLTWDYDGATLLLKAVRAVSLTLWFHARIGTLTDFVLDPLIFAVR